MIQSQIFNFLLSTSDVIPLLEGGKEVIEEVFPFKASSLSLFTLMDYYKKFKTVPSKVGFTDFRAIDSKWTKFVGSIDKEQLALLKEFDKGIFQEIAKGDLPMVKEFVKELLIKHKVVELDDEYNNRVQKGESSVQVLRDISQKQTTIATEVEDLIDGVEDEMLYMIDENVPFNRMKSKSGIQTAFLPIRFYWRGITTILAGAKSYKTGVAICTAVDMAEKGLDVLMFDLENGLENYGNRIAQSIMKAPKECVFSNTYVNVSLLSHDSRFPSNKGWEEYDDTIKYRKGDRVYRIVHHCKKAGAKYSFDTTGDTWSTKVRLFEACRDFPEIIEADDWDKNFDFWKEYYPDVADDNLYLDWEEEYARVARNCKAEGWGQILPKYLKQATPSKIMAHIERHINDFTTANGSKFFKDPNRRVVIIDWMSLLKSSTGKRLPIWELTNDNYLELKAIRDKYDVSMLCIEGASNPELLRKAGTFPRDVNTKGSRQTNFDVVAKVALMATEEEMELNIRRLQTSEDRNSKPQTCYFKFFPETQTFESLTIPEHKALCKEYWKEIEGDKDDDFGEDAADMSRILVI